MADSSEKRDEEEEEEEELDETSYIAQKDAVLFAIDVSESMLAPPPPSDDKKAEKDSPVAAAIKCAYQIMQQRIISNPKDMMGILLFDTEQTKFQDEDEDSRGAVQYPHCYLLSDLAIPAAEDVKTIRGVVRQEEEFKDLFVPAKEPVSMSNMLFCANQIFTTRAPNFGSRRLFIITDKDDPHASDKNARSQAAIRAKDLYDLGVVIELFPISHPDHEFDRSKFYDDIIYRDPAAGEDLAVAQSNFKSSGSDGISLLSNLISDINSKQVAKRALFSNLPFEIGPNFKITVKGYNLLQKQEPKKKGYVWLDGETKQYVEGETTQVTENTARTVEKVEIKKAYKFGGSLIHFTPEEQQKLKDFGSPVLRIIGFKPQFMLPLWASVKKSTFIYPSEEDYVGSTRVFSALWQKLNKDKKMGVAWYIARKNASPILVAILPSEERADDTTKLPIIPTGLWLYPLPFADDKRDLPQLPKPLVASDRLTSEMHKVSRGLQKVRDGLSDEEEKVIKQLQLPKAVYDHSKYPNPALQWHYKILQVLALDEELPDKPEDKTIPKYRQIDKRAGDYINEWGRILDKEYRGMENDRKQKFYRNESEEPPKKKIKPSHSSQTLDEMTLSELKKVVGTGGLGKYTVQNLKDFLNAKGLEGKGKKPELIEKVEQYVEDN